MPQSVRNSLLTALLVLAGIAGSTGEDRARQEDFALPAIPKTWDDEALASVELPLAGLGSPPAHIPAAFYYQIPVRPIYKTYPVYVPGKEPPGYNKWLEQQEPQVVFDTAKLTTEADWIKAGELVFDAPISLQGDVLTTVNVSEVRDPKWYETAKVPVLEDGTVPFVRYVIRKKGVVEVGNLACAMCHTRVMPDGTVIKGAQGNFPFDRVIAYLLRSTAAKTGNPKKVLEDERLGIHMIFGAPWIHPDTVAPLDQMSLEQMATVYDAIPPGTLARHGTSPFWPVQVPDLIGVKERRYLDHTGLVRHRDVGDLMRYGALNQDADYLSRYGAFRPIEVMTGKLPEPASFSRYSDEQLYALGLYIYSLQPPLNPNKFDAVAEQGKKVFERESCGNCHTPPLYTNNKLTPANEFEIPEGHEAKFDILATAVGTDNTLALKTRRGTGYYKVPSLKGVWYRGPFEHNGSVATLEDWFDPQRVRASYVPTGFVGTESKTRAVKGHRFGLGLSAEDRKALIAFLKTL